MCDRGFGIVNLRIDEKEEFLWKLCEEYGLLYEYGWGKYYVSVKGVSGEVPFDTTPVLIFNREDLYQWDTDRIEEIILEYVVLRGDRW